MPRRREYQDAAQKQQAYRDRKAKLEEQKMLDRCAWYQVCSEMKAAGLSFEGETRDDILREVCSLIWRSGAAGSGGRVEFPEL